MLTVFRSDEFVRAWRVFVIVVSSRKKMAEEVRVLFYEMRGMLYTPTTMLLYMTAAVVAVRAV
jgi:hypothetical protein